MNFEYMWSIKHGHTDKLYVFDPYPFPCSSQLVSSFWIIAIPVLAVVMPAFMWPDILRMYHHTKKRSLDRNVLKARP
jgi:hypothetical protein